MSDLVFSDHALFEMQRRNIEKDVVLQIITSPDTVRDIRPGRRVFHKTLFAQSAKKALLYRVFIDVDCTPRVIVTVYATSKIAKYEVFQ